MVRQANSERAVGKSDLKEGFCIDKQLAINQSVVGL